jgi:hypothetical protein
MNINKEGKVVGIYGINADGKEAVRTVRLKGQDVDVATESLISYMLEAGYINEELSAVLVSVESRDEELLSELQYVVSDTASYAISDVLSNGIVLDQGLDPEPNTKALAERYNITPGKAYLIQQLTSAGIMASESELAEGTVTSLISKCIENGVDLSQYVDIIGDSLEEFYADDDSEDYYDGDDSYYNTELDPDSAEDTEGEYEEEAGIDDSADEVYEEEADAEDTSDEDDESEIDWASELMSNSGRNTGASGVYDDGYDDADDGDTADEGDTSDDDYYYDDGYVDDGYFDDGTIGSSDEEYLE